MIIKLNVTHSLLETNFIEIRFDIDSTITQVKNKIYTMTGTAPAHQDLKLVRNSKEKISLYPENATLRDFGAEDGMDLECIDRNCYSILNAIQNQNVEDVYYKMTDEEYDKRSDTVRAYKREKFEKDPVYRQQVLEARKKRLEAIKAEMDAASKIHVGDRCNVPKKESHGTVRYIGDYEGEVGIWIGIELDLPKGNEQQVCKQYFECEDCKRCMVKPTDVEIGEFSIQDELECSSEL